MVEENILQNILGELLLTGVKKANALIPEWVVPISLCLFLFFLFLLLKIGKLRKKEGEGDGDKGVEEN